MLIRRGFFKVGIFIILVSLVLTGARIFSFCAEPEQSQSYQASVEDISGNKYLPAVKDALKNAKKSIYMAMYFVSFDPKDNKSPVTDLVEELVNAHKRGVKIEVILDQNIDFDAWNAAKAGWEKENKAVHYLPI